MKNRPKRNMKCSDTGEFKLIARIARQLRSQRARGVVAGIGDDTAVLTAGGGNRLLLFTTDPVIEGTHFLFERRRGNPSPCATPYQVGWKAMARNLSDIAAMGGLPRWAVVSLALPSRTPLKVVDGIYRGIRAAGDAFDAVIVGGDITSTSGPLSVTVSLIGEVERKWMKLRSTARPGEMVFVTGELGGSSLGKHLKFTPRIAEARWLVSNFPVKAMMDVSDGLGSDLRRIADASNVGFDIIADAVPVSAAARKLSRQSGDSALKHAWSDGEDFELLFTLPPRYADLLLKRWHPKFPLALSPIGTVTAAKGRVRLIGGKDAQQIANSRGFEHFE